MAPNTRPAMPAAAPATEPMPTSNLAPAAELEVDDDAEPEPELDPEPELEAPVALEAPDEAPLTAEETWLDTEEAADESSEETEEIAEEAADVAVSVEVSEEDDDDCARTVVDGRRVSHSASAPFSPLQTCCENSPWLLASARAATSVKRNLVENCIVSEMYAFDCDLGGDGSGWSSRDEQRTFRPFQRFPVFYFQFVTCFLTVTA